MTEFFTVVVLHMFAVMSPGPDFFLVSRQSIRYGRTIALWTAGGIGTGILFHSGHFPVATHPLPPDHLPYRIQCI